MLEQIQQLSNFDYCRLHYLSDGDLYQFGWEGGLHFYLHDFKEIDELGQFQLDVWLNKVQHVPTKLSFTFEEMIEHINNINNY